MSGQRFGGDFSPGRAKSGRADPATTAASALPSNRFRGRKAARVDIRSRLLYVLPTPLLFSAFGAIGGGNPVDTALALAAYASLMAGAWLLTEGQ